MIERILCATDGSAASAKAVGFAARLAASLSAKITVLAVTTVSAESASRTHFWDSEVLAVGDAQLRAELAEAARTVEVAGIVEVDYVVTCGRNPADAIIHYADHNGFDHIVCGSHGRGGLAGLLLGSVANSVAARAHCPVTVVH